MGMTRTVATLVGSLRRDSFNRKVAHTLADLAAPVLAFDFVEIGNLPLYNQDLDAAPPQVWKDFRDRVRKSDAVLFVTPEYNRSVPGVLKNAIDVGSRPYGHSAWEGKPAAVVSVSPGGIGGFGGAATLFDESGKLKNEDTRAYFKKFVDAYASWIDLVLAGK
jgi:chromate reductase